jgi:hypothetical protein
MPGHCSEIAKDGFGDGEVDTQIPGGPYWLAQSSGLHLLQAAPTNGIIKLSNTEEISGSEPEGGLTYSVQTDSRTVVLKRPGAVNEWTDYTTNPSMPTTHGDTIYSASPSDIGADPNFQVVQANLQGPWGTLSSWSWTDPNGDDTSTSHIEETPYGSVYYIGLSGALGVPDPPRQKTFYYNCTDSADDAQAAAAYVLTAHDEIDEHTVTQCTQIDNKYYDWCGPAWAGTPATGTIQSYGIDWTMDGVVGNGVIQASTVLIPALTKNAYVSAGLQALGLGCQLAGLLPTQSVSESRTEAQYEADVNAGEDKPELANMVVQIGMDNVWTGNGLPPGDQLEFEVHPWQYQYEGLVSAMVWNQDGYVCPSISRVTWANSAVNYDDIWGLNTDF